MDGCAHSDRLGQTLLFVWVGMVTALIGDAAVAQATVRPRVRVVAGRPGETPSDRPIGARRGEKVVLYAVYMQRAGSKRVYFTSAPGLIMKRRSISPSRIRPFSELGKVAFRWYIVEPHQQHVKLPSPNTSSRSYANAVLFGPRHGKWLGYDTLEYHETRLVGQSRGLLVVNRATPTHPKLKANKGLGTMRYKVSVRVGRRWVSSPGAGAVKKRGISPRVMRLTFRQGDDFVGFLTGYFNVPYVFGSAGSGSRHQTEQYQGTDCADVFVGAARRAGARIPYTSAAGLKRYTRTLTPRLVMSKQGFYRAQKRKPGRAVRYRFGKTIRRGDLMLIDYIGFKGSPRSWDHIAVLARDRGQKGILDPKDTILHMGFRHGLIRASVASEGPAVVEFIRFKARYLNAMRRKARKISAQRKKRTRKHTLPRQHQDDTTMTP